MAILKFIAGTVSSGKTISLIKLAHQLRVSAGNSAVHIFKPICDVRTFGNTSSQQSASDINSASGLSIKTTYLVKHDEDILNIDEYKDIKYILVDEIQFFSNKQIEQLREVVYKYDISIYCFGLLKDFKCQLFDASKRLIELCDELEVVPSICYRCSWPAKSASFNLFVKEFENANENKTNKDNSTKNKITNFVLGGIEKFQPVCYDCYAGQSDN